MTTKRCAAAAFMGWAALGLAAGCGRLPGKPTERERWVPPAQVTDFHPLYTQNCAGCHGAEGHSGSARPLNDPLYLALAGADALRQVISKGVPGTAMPAFAQSAGGGLTDQQIDRLVEGMQTRWGRPDEFTKIALPPYRQSQALAQGESPGDPQRGAAVYKNYCAFCHGAEGQGGPKGGAVVDPNYLALVSDQSLRTTVIAGRFDLGQPDWRGYVAGRPMTGQEISDVVAWLRAQRGDTTPAQPVSSENRPAESRTASTR